MTLPPPSLCHRPPPPPLVLPCRTHSPPQVSLLVEQVDQYDRASSSHAALKGIRAEPQQPELPRLREALAAADKVVLLAEGADVSEPGWTWGCAERLCPAAMQQRQ